MSTNVSAVPAEQVNTLAMSGSVCTDPSQGPVIVTNFINNQLFSAAPGATIVINDTTIVNGIAYPSIVCGLVVPHSNLHITINGHLQLAPLAISAILLFQPLLSNVTIDGYGILDGDSNWFTYASVGAAPSQDLNSCPANCFGILVQGGSNITIGSPNNQLTFINTGGSAVTMINVNAGTMENLVIQNSRGSVAFVGSNAEGTTGGHATNLSISGSGDEAFAFYGSVHDSYLANSIIQYGASSGVSILNDLSQPMVSSNITIDNVTSQFNYLSGVEIQTGNCGTPNACIYGNPTKITISDSVLTNNDQGHVGVGEIWNVVGQNVSVANNQVSNGP